jgi:UDP-GlcNAc:undecaprenyl-phosphate GlcNAc-1-phosphate transferase
MKLAVVGLVIISFALSWLLTRAMRIIAVRIGFVDKPGGRKIHANPKPLGGGVAIFWAFALPIIAGLLFIHGWTSPPPWLHLSERFATDASTINAYWSGLRQQTPLAAALLAAAFGMHVLGLVDDRKALGPYSKLIIQLSITAALVLAFSDHMRILTFLDTRIPFGFWISTAATVLWIGAITNAFNFLDNMDGLSAGVACVCTIAFLVAAVSIGYSQWFVAATLALLLGSMLGFLWHNFPPAKIFMGDSGSLLIGLILGVMTVRTTYLPPKTQWPNAWYAVFAPVVVLALPLYDLIVVSIIRMMRGKSPFAGDTNHFSHRLVNRGMSRRTAVLCLYLVTASTSIAAILLPHVNGHFAVYIFVQTILILCMVALLEQHPLPTPPVIKDESRPQPEETIKL